MGKGGIRPGAGRKPNSGIYGEKTVPKRIPVSLTSHIEQLINGWKTGERLEFSPYQEKLKERRRTEHPPLFLPLYSSRVQAGFPSPADDFLEASLDLNHYLIQHPAATFFVRTSGDSMIGAGIHNNDILIVDRSLEPKSGMIVIAAVNAELTIKRLHKEAGIITLRPENPDYASLIITEETDFYIWGVVTSVIHEFKRRI